MIGIINYGSGNVKSFENVFLQNKVSFKNINSKNDFANINGLILPGVGAFDNVLQKLNNSGFRHELEYLVLEKGIPILGICVGMQIMSIGSAEGVEKGLGWINANVEKFKINKRLPHMGWNKVLSVKKNILFDSIDNEEFYFLHSYFFSLKDNANTLAVTDYGEQFCCAISHKNIYGVQFHPEKSHSSGEKLLLNFVRKICA